MSRGVALAFPGQGAQQVRMGAGLYEAEPAFAGAVDEILAAMRDGEALRRDWLSVTPEVAVDHVTRSTPLLFAIGYGLGRLAMRWGLEPVAMIGHSIGEMVAATLADVFSPQVAARLVDDRVRVLAAAPSGGMLAVAAGPPELARYLGGDLAIGAMNAPRQTILSGLTESLDRVEARLRADGFTCRRVPALNPFHSPVMAGLVDVERPAFMAAAPRPPRRVIYSAYTAGLLDAEAATDPMLWAGHPSRPVLFWPALDALLRDHDVLLVEAGPGQGLTSLARRHPAVASGRSAAVAMLPVRAGDAAADRETAVACRARCLNHLGLGPVGPAAEQPAVPITDGPTGTARLRSVVRVTTDPGRRVP